VTDRLAMVLRTLPLAVVLDSTSRRGGSPATGSGAGGMAFKAMAWLLAGCLAVAAAGALLGWVGLATILAGGALGTLGGIILIVATGPRPVGTAPQSPSRRTGHQGLRMVREHADLVARKCLGALRVFAVLVAASISVYSFGFGFGIRRLLASVLGAKATLGSISISPGPIVGFVLILWISVLFSRLLAFLLAEEVLPRLDLRRGTAVAISGDDTLPRHPHWVRPGLGRRRHRPDEVRVHRRCLVSASASALQNIVSNFIAGLILLFERPIQVGMPSTSPGRPGPSRRSGSGPRRSTRSTGRTSSSRTRT